MVAASGHGGRMATRPSACLQATAHAKSELCSLSDYKPFAALGSPR